MTSFHRAIYANWSELFGEEIRILDRTALILDIFAQHASTREGALQVELAQYEYQVASADTRLDPPGAPGGRWRRENGQRGWRGLAWARRNAA